MPANAGIHLRFRGRPKKTWIPAPDQVRGQALRRNYERKSRLLVDEFRTPRLEPRVIQFRLSADQFCILGHGLPWPSCRLSLCHQSRQIERRATTTFLQTPVGHILVDEPQRAGREETGTVGAVVNEFAKLGCGVGVFLKAARA